MAMDKLYLEDFAEGQRFTSGELTIDKDGITSFARQLDPQRLLAERDGEFVVQPAHQIEQTPADHAVNRRDRAGFNSRA